MKILLTGSCDLAKQFLLPLFAQHSFSLVNYGNYADKSYYYAHDAGIHINEDLTISVRLSSQSLLDEEDLTDLKAMVKVLIQKIGEK